MNWRDELLASLKALEGAQISNVQISTLGISVEFGDLHADPHFYTEIGEKSLFVQCYWTINETVGQLFNSDTALEADDGHLAELALDGTIVEHVALEDTNNLVLRVTRQRFFRCSFVNQRSSEDDYWCLYLRDNPNISTWFEITPRGIEKKAEPAGLTVEERISKVRAAGHHELADKMKKRIRRQK